jgi:hypothetical protein
MCAIVSNTIEVIDPEILLKAVHASCGKVIQAELVVFPICRVKFISFVHFYILKIMCAKWIIDTEKSPDLCFGQS